MHELLRVKLDGPYLVSFYFLLFPAVTYLDWRRGFLCASTSVPEEARINLIKFWS